MFGAHGCKKELSVFLVLERTDVVNPMRVLAIQPGSSDKAVNACNHWNLCPSPEKSTFKSISISMWQACQLLHRLKEELLKR